MAAVEDIQENLDNEIVRNALERGEDLRVYAQQVAEELSAAEEALLLEYTHATTKKEPHGHSEDKHAVTDEHAHGDAHSHMSVPASVAKLHSQLLACDTALQDMEDILGGFQSNLGHISGEIKNLQEQSLVMNIKLKNRQAVQARLSSIVEDIAITPELISAIMADSVSPEFEQAIQQLHTKLDFADTHTSTTAAVSDVLADLDKLKNHAVATIREFQLSRILALRRPHTNIRVQQDALSRHPALFLFLHKHHRQTAAEIRNEYIDTVSKVHFSYFKAYIGRLMKLEYDTVPDKDDMLAAEDVSGKRTSIFSSKPNVKSRATTFTLGTRDSVLKDLDAPILVPHAADKAGGKDKRPYEQLFRSLQKAVVDCGAREFLFGLDFFCVRESKGTGFLKAVFGKAISVVMKHLEQYFSNCFDGLCVFLCIRIIKEFQASLTKQNVDGLDFYFEAVEKLLWDRLKFIINANISSIRDVKPELLSHLDTRPHFIVRRYAEYSGALHRLMQGPAGEWDPLLQLLRVLQQEVENLIFRVAAEFPDRKQQLIFLINNYDMMISVFSEQTSGTPEEAHLQQLLKDRIEEFAKVELAPAFGGIIGFVKKAEASLASDPKGQFPVNHGEIASLVSSFAASWKSAIDDIGGDVMVSFTNFKNGTAILQEALTQLVISYDKFVGLLRKPPFKAPGGYKDLVDPHQLMVEVKKHKTTF